MTLSTIPPIIYPESDGKPMADNTIQFRLITTIVNGMDALFAQEQDVFVAGDLLWYPVEGKDKIKQAPDAMVVFGREKGDRGSYKQWEEENIPPQVVFEIASHSNTKIELEETKHRFYQRYGVEEYYLFYPERVVLKGWLRCRETLETISDMSGWISPRLGVRFEVINQKLQLFRSSGEPFATYVEIMEQREFERERADIEFRRAEREFQRAQQESQRAQQESRRAERAERELQEAVPRLLGMGLTVQQVAAALNLPREEVSTIMEN